MNAFSSKVLNILNDLPEDDFYTNREEIFYIGKSDVMNQLNDQFNQGIDNLPNFDLLVYHIEEQDGENNDGSSEYYEGYSYMIERLYSVKHILEKEEEEKNNI